MPARDRTEVIIPARDIIEYLRLRGLGYRALWVGEGKIAMALEISQVFCSGGARGDDVDSR